MNTIKMTVQVDSHQAAWIAMLVELWAVSDPESCFALSMFPRFLEILAARLDGPQEDIDALADKQGWSLRDRRLFQAWLWAMDGGKPLTWVCAADTLPTEDGYYLVCGPRADRDCAFWSPREQAWQMCGPHDYFEIAADSGEITHWMLLPDPPKKTGS